MSSKQETEDWRAEAAHLVEATIAARGVTHEAVLGAVAAVPRHRFVPEGLRPEAYTDDPLPIGEHQTISQPYVVAVMAEAAGVRPGSRVLDVGTGSGYQAAVLAELGATVFSVERSPTLARTARAALEATVADCAHRVHLRVGDGKEGWEEHAPFDAILVAAAAERVPEPLIDQLGVGGRLVIPVGSEDYQELVVLEHMHWGEIRRRSLMRVLFVPLI